MNTRRAFVLGAMSAAAVVAAPSRFASRLRFTNDGQTLFDYVRWNPFLTPPPDFSGLPPNAEIRVRNVFPYQERDIIETLVYLRLPNGGTAPISHIFTEVEDVQITEAAVSADRRTLALTGKVVANPIPSPFGYIVGRATMFSGVFDRPGLSTRFEFFGGMVAGSHVTIVPEAFGSLEIKTPWGSF